MPQIKLHVRVKSFLGGILNLNTLGFTPSSPFLKQPQSTSGLKKWSPFPEESVPFWVDLLFWSSFVNLSVPSSLLVSLTLLHGVHSLLFWQWRLKQIPIYPLQGYFGDVIPCIEWLWCNSSQVPTVLSQAHQASMPPPNKYQWQHQWAACRVSFGKLGQYVFTT